MAIVDSYSENSYLSDQVLADLTPIKWQFHRLLLWQLIFHSYSQNSYLAHQVLEDLVPHQMVIIDSYSKSSYLADQVLADIPPTSNGNCRLLLWELIFGRPSVGRYTPLLNADFTDSCFDSSYFIPTLRTHIWHTRCWQIQSPIKWWL